MWTRSVAAIYLAGFFPSILAASDSARHNQPSHNNSIYDYIIVSAGIAKLVVTNQLTKDRYSILSSKLNT